MSRSASRRWTAACLLGIAAWIGVTVLAGALADDPTDPKPTLIAFAAGGTAFFGAIFGYSLWRTRRRPEPELDALLGELSLEPGGRPRRP
jgi:membrane protein DedA with SNARE-associated domain